MLLRDFGLSIEDDYLNIERLVKLKVTERKVILY